MNALFDLTGKTALVTGARTGLGQGMALALARAGADIAALGSSPMPETAALVREAGVRFHELTVDLSKRFDASATIAEIVAALGGIDILVNNAGIIRRADAVEFSEADWDDVMDVNLKALFFTCQAFAKELLAKGRPGKIVNVASLLSFQGGIRVPSYTASKHGVSGLTKLLANEWASKGINVNAIAPGYIETNNTEALRDDPDRNKAILDRIPANRWGKPKDIAGAAVFLSSAVADYVHGAILNVDGGWLAR